MQIVLLGSGNVAAVLGRKFHAAGHQIAQILSRNAKAASALAYELDSESTNYSSVLNTTADIYIVAVADKAIAEVVKGLKLPGKVIAHTAASVPMEVLKEVSQHYGVFYPFQSLRAEIPQAPDIPIYFQGNDAVAEKKLKSLADSISSVPPQMANQTERIKLHLSAVLVSNFVNHLYALAEEFCKREGIDFRQLIPLINETALRVEHTSPSLSQTGPAVRNDIDTIQKHLELLKNYPELTKLYEDLSASIKKFHH